MQGENQGVAAGLEKDPALGGEAGEGARRAQARSQQIDLPLAGQAEARQPAPAPRPALVAGRAALPWGLIRF